jgi:hypothetical protein
MNAIHVDKSAVEGTVHVTRRYKEVKNRFKSKYYFSDIALAQVDPEEYVRDLEEYYQCRQEFVNFLRSQD